MFDIPSILLTLRTNSNDLVNYVTKVNSKSLNILPIDRIFSFSDHNTPSHCGTFVIIMELPILDGFDGKCFHFEVTHLLFNKLTGNDKKNEAIKKAINFYGNN